MGPQDQENLKEAEEITLRVSPSAEEGAISVDVTDGGVIDGAGSVGAGFVGSGSDDASVGTTLDKRYRVDSLIGNGATSSVYKCYDLQRKRDVAIKILHRHLSGDSAVVRRFEQEAETARIVTHPNIVAIHDLNKTEQGQPYLVMDYVEGHSLQDVMSDCGGSLEWRRAVDIALQVSAALRAAHEKGVVHRDMKPANIMIAKGSSGEDFVKVLDFGIAKVTPTEGDTFFKMTQTGETLGSLLYMSPEQCNGEAIDARSDVYSLGCVLYEIATGTAPHTGRTAFETMNKHVSAMPERLRRVRPNLEFPDGLERVIFKAVSKKPTDRYQSIGDFQDDLVALKDGRAVGAPDNAGVGGNVVAGDAAGAPFGFKESTKFVIDLIGLFFLYMVCLMVMAGLALWFGSTNGGHQQTEMAVLFAFIVTMPLPAYVTWKLFTGKKV